eukprot:2027553-Pleurochrysis_carterae.AAC.1
MHLGRARPRRPAKPTAEDERTCVGWIRAWIRGGYVPARERTHEYEYPSARVRVVRIHVRARTHAPPIRLEQVFMGERCWTSSWMDGA